jgi:predicted dehydrogenase
MQTQPVSLLMVGTGTIANRYAKELLEIPNVQIVATVSRTLGAAEQFTKQYPQLCPKSVCCFQSFDKAMEWGDFDASYVCTWNDSHVPIGVKLIQANKPVFMEKPVALNIEDCLPICQAMDEMKGRVMMGGLGFRYYSRSLCSLKHYLHQPKLITGRFISPRWPDDFWATQDDQGGVFLSSGSHLMDMAYFVTGSEPIRICAAGGSYQHSLSRIDTLVCQIEFQNGALASLSFGDCGEIAGLGEMTLEVYDGTRSVRIEEFLPTKKLPIFTERKGYFEEAAQWNGVYPDCYQQPSTPSEEFIRWIRTGVRSVLFPTLKDGIRAVTMMEKAVLSVHSGGWQPIVQKNISQGYFS